MNNDYNDSYDQIRPEPEPAVSFGADLSDGIKSENVNYKKSLLFIGIGVAVLAALWYGSQYPIFYLLDYLFPELDPNWMNWILSFISLYGIALPGMYLLIRLAKRSTPVPKDKFTFGHWLILALIGYAFLMVGSFASTSLMSAVNLLTGDLYENSLDSIIDAPWWQMLLFPVILAPIGEEFIFRKLLIDRLNVFGDKTAILLSALFFGLFHGNLYQLIYATLLGLVLGYIYSYTGKLRYSIALHMTVNFTNGFLSSRILNAVDLDKLLEMTDVSEMTTYISENLLPIMLMLLFTAAMYGLMIAGIILFFVRRRRIKLAGGRLGLSKSETKRAVISSPGIICGVACCLALTVLWLLSPIL